MTNFLFSPLEQFHVLPFSLSFLNLTIFSNALLVFIILGIATVIYPHTFLKNICTNSGFIVPSDTALWVELIIQQLIEQLKKLLNQKNVNIFFLQLLLSFY